MSGPGSIASEMGCPQAATNHFISAEAVVCAASAACAAPLMLKDAPTSWKAAPIARSGF
jgi:hypothetical protein